MSVHKRDEDVVYGDIPTTCHIRELTRLADWLRERTPSDDPGLRALDWARQRLGDTAKFSGTKTLQEIDPAVLEEPTFGHPGPPDLPGQEKCERCHGFLGDDAYGHHSRMCRCEKETTCITD